METSINITYIPELHEHSHTLEQLKQIEEHIDAIFIERPYGGITTDTIFEFTRFRQPKDVQNIVELEMFQSWTNLINDSHTIRSKLLGDNFSPFSDPHGFSTPVFQLDNLESSRGVLGRMEHLSFLTDILRETLVAFIDEEDNRVQETPREQSTLKNGMASCNNEYESLIKQMRGVHSSLFTRREVRWITRIREIHSIIHAEIKQEEHHYVVITGAGHSFSMYQMLSQFAEVKVVHMEFDFFHGINQQLSHVVPESEIIKLDGMELVNYQLTIELTSIFFSMVSEQSEMLIESMMAAGLDISSLESNLLKINYSTHSAAFSEPIITLALLISARILDTKGEYALDSFKEKTKEWYCGREIESLEVLLKEGEKDWLLALMLSKVSKSSNDLWLSKITRIKEDPLSLIESVNQDERCQLIIDWLQHCKLEVIQETPRIAFRYPALDKTSEIRLECFVNLMENHVRIGIQIPKPKGGIDLQQFFDLGLSTHLTEKVLTIETRIYNNSLNRSEFVTRLGQLCTWMNKALNIT